ncbi:hypothetical protein K470DRAFT_294673 [Piedraia hortae CBS 480.64]|uniref:Spindle pole body-associated protein cut12 domain-containing protein n=1 Tax=Piedraia hortae CBS 480.64 TaxID=1314780 RepID=A0A6A7C1S7_9PEZI|nr:hypothetical protein K470DRAFT_294673 [Piedraia hortae CBS 480.64]
MLNWLSGGKASEMLQDPDSACLDAPETPAPVFAVRAFKHAIFGTPQTSPARSRRHTGIEEATRHQNSRPKLHALQSKGLGDVPVLGGPNEVFEPMNSPTKGILLTPGAATSKRKTVTFGEHVLGPDEQRAKNGGPDGPPGRFPSPWKSDNDEEKSRGRNKLTEAFEQVREESAKRKKADRRSRHEEPERREPRTEEGRYWKTQYDVYRENSQKDVKKLIAKQKMAKRYAKDKDEEANELAEQLREEKKEVERLEKKMSDLEALVEDMREHLRRLEERREVQPEVGSPGGQQYARRSARQAPEVQAQATSRRRAPRTVAEPVPIPPPHDFRHSPRWRPEPDMPPTPPTHEEKFLTQSIPSETLPASHESDKNEQSPVFPTQSTPPELARPPRKPVPSRNSRTVTSGTDLTPLSALASTLQSNRRDSVQLQNEEKKRSEVAPLKPSAAWNAINAPPAALIGRDGKELSSDRLESARARLAARGRVIS